MQETAITKPDYAPELQQALFKYTLQLADTSLILAHRLSEWCGHGPVLEQDLALSNIALDLLGEARSYYQYAAVLEDQGRDEDDLAYLRQAVEYRNPLLVEQPNGDFAATIFRQFLFDSFHYFYLLELQKSPDTQLAAIAEKSVKEAAYHIKWSSEWVIRLGDGTEESKRRMEAAVEDLWPYSQELFEPTATERKLQEQGLIPQYQEVQKQAEAHRQKVMSEATLNIPENAFMQQGGKEGRHSEHLGYILAELQYLQRAYPGQKW